MRPRGEIVAMAWRNPTQTGLREVGKVLSSDVAV
jgi:hypothetical protein